MFDDHDVGTRPTGVRVHQRLEDLLEDRDVEIVAIATVPHCRHRHAGRRGREARRDREAARDHPMQTRAVRWFREHLMAEC